MLVTRMGPGERGNLVAAVAGQLHIVGEQRLESAGGELAHVLSSLMPTMAGICGYL